MLAFVSNYTMDVGSIMASNLTGPAMAAVELFKGEQRPIIVARSSCCQFVSALVCRDLEAGE